MKSVIFSLVVAVIALVPAHEAIMYLPMADGVGVGSCAQSVKCAGYNYTHFVKLTDIAGSQRPGYKVYLVLYVQGPHDGHVLLSETPNTDRVRNEIFYGGWDNTRSGIRTQCQGPILASSNTKGVMNPDIPVKIIVSLGDDNYVRASYVNGDGVTVSLMELHDPSPAPIYVSFAGYLSNPTFWYNCPNKMEEQTCSYVCTSS